MVWCEVMSLYVMVMCVRLECFLRVRSSAASAVDIMFKLGRFLMGEVMSLHLRASCVTLDRLLMG